MSLAIESSLPGVTALVNQGQVARPFQRQPTSTAFAVGVCAWGPLGVATVVTSWADFVRKFGGFTKHSYLPEFAYIFFNHFGGAQMVVCRAGDDAAAALETLILDTDKVTTKSKYVLHTESALSITVSDDAVNAGAKVFTVEEAYTKQKEVFDNLKFGDADEIAASIAAVNARSNLITLVSATAAPTNATYNFGSTDSDGADVFTADDAVPFLAQFETEDFGTGQVVAPGLASAALHAALVAHAEAFQRLAICDPQLGRSTSQVVSDFSSVVSSHSAVYYPWVEMLDIAGSGVKKFYPPSCFAAGACAMVDRTIGTHKAPANINVPNALDIEKNSDGTTLIDDGAREYLNSKQINVIAPLPGQGIKIYGGRVRYEAGDTRLQFVHERRVLNLVYYTAKIGYAWAVFAVVDGQGRLFRDLVASGKTFLRNLWRNGALYGKTEQEAFVVIADESNNPPEELDEGRVHVQLGVKLSPTAEQIFVNIDNVPLSQDLNVLNGGDA